MDKKPLFCPVDVKRLIGPVSLIGEERLLLGVSIRVASMSSVAVGEGLLCWIEATMS